MSDFNKPKVICIVGPTASGKTKLSIELAKKVNGEVISCDSMQIYKKLSVGTAKVTKEEMQGIKHHLVDFVDIDEEFSVADYKKLCYEKIEDIISRGKTPIIVGGTGLYMSSVILNMDFKEECVDNEYRERLYNIAKEKGNEYVHNLLKEVDEGAAEEIHPNNLKRVIRALEMYHSNNKKSEYIMSEENRIKQQKSLYDFKLFCTYFPKDELHNRINKRVDLMIEAGLEEEAKLVYKLNKGTVRQAVGYKEFFEYFEGNKTLDEVIEEIKLRTRQYAKRQNTWFKKMPDVKYIDMNNTLEENINNILEIVYER